MNNLALINQDGTAFTCPAANWSGKKSDFYYHFTITHITTRDKRIVELVHKTIEAFVKTEVPLTNNYQTLSWIPGKKGKRSLLVTGVAADFKINLHHHLIQDPRIAPYVSPFKKAHVDVRGDFTKQLYPSFTLDQIIERKT